MTTQGAPPQQGGGRLTVGEGIVGIGEGLSRGGGIQGAELQVVGAERLLAPGGASSRQCVTTANGARPREAEPLDLGRQHEVVEKTRIVTHQAHGCNRGTGSYRDELLEKVVPNPLKWRRAQKGVVINASDTASHR